MSEQKSSDIETETSLTLLWSKRLSVKQTSCVPRLPGGGVFGRSWQGSHSQIPSLNIKRHLQVKIRKRNLFSGNHRRDKVPPEFSVIYNSTLGPWFTFFRIGSGTMWGMMVVVVYNILPEISSEFFTTEKGFFLCASTIFLTVFTVAFSMVARRFFSRIYCHAESGRFIGVRRDFFGRLKQLNYTMEDVKPTAIQPWKMKDGGESAVVNIRGQQMQILGHHFVSPTYYNLHLGEGSLHSELVREPKF